MAWHRRWLRVSTIALSGLLLPGCARDLPEWALYKQATSNDIALPAAPLVRSQNPEIPPLTLPKPAPPLTNTAPMSQSIRYNQ